MGNVLVDEQSLTNIGNAIRNRNEELTTYKPREMAAAIKDLHNVIPKKWVRPSTWPDYSEVDLTGQEVIYLTYDCTRGNDWISIRVYGNYTVVRGSLSNGVFTASSTATNMDSGTVFREALPTNEGNYVVYKITPQSGSNITRFEFARRDVTNASQWIRSWQQPCVERYCRIPNWIGTGNRTAEQYTWSTRNLISDEVMDASPTNLVNAYNDGVCPIKRVNMSTCSFKNVTSLASMFDSKRSLFDVSLPHDLGSSCTAVNNMFYECYNLRFLDISGWDTSNVTTFSRFICNCYNLNEIKGHEDLKFTSCTTLYQAFRYLYNLRKLDTSKWTTTSALTNMEGVFDSAYLITELNVDGFNTENVTTFYSSFAALRSIEVLDVSKIKVTNKCTNLYYMFGGCRSLRKLIRTKNWDVSNVTTFESMFRDCHALEELDLSDFDPEKVTTTKAMFDSCYSLKTLDLEDWDLTTITNTSNVLGFISSCYNLKEVKLPETLYLPGLNYCHSLKKLVVPSTVTSIGTGDNNMCRAMWACEYVDFSAAEAITPISNTGVFNTDWNAKILFIVPDNLYSSWITATNWSNGSYDMRTISVSDWNFYNGESENVTGYVDLSSCNWTTNYSYSTSAAVGTAYASTVNNASNGKRIISGLVDIPDKAIKIDINDGYAYTILMYDSNGNFLKQWYCEWVTGTGMFRYSPANKIAIVVRLGDGTTALAPADWADSGITLSYDSGVPIS